MTPQSSFMIVAAIIPQREDELRQLLASMNRAPGNVDPLNAVVPFSEFEQVHFARIVILKDDTLDDITSYGLARVEYSTYLVFLGDVDGEAEAFLTQLAERAGSGLRRLFSCCEAFSEKSTLLDWMKIRNTAPATIYVNWIGRTVKQVDEEESLRQALQNFIRQNSESLNGMKPLQVNDALKRFVETEQKSGHLTLTPEQPTPLEWQLRNLLHLLGVPLLLLLASPFLLLYLPFFFIQLRRLETTDPQIAPRVDPAHADQLASLEDHDVTNQFSALGSLKPGRFRSWTIIFLLWIIDYTAKHIYNRGHLARVSTIHFARWVFLDDKKRLFFASNYDGSLESYMDDFINKVGFGLNVVFSNGVGYPKTSWLFLQGAKDEQAFKNFLRRHQLPTQVWYSAHPGLTALDKQRNMLIRRGLEQSLATDSEIQEWLRLL
jgi:hypothetical protein